MPWTDRPYYQYCYRMDKGLIAKIFGEELRKVRGRAEISQEKLALEADVDRSFLSKMERGIRQPSLTVIFKLCSALNYPPEQLILDVRSRL